MNDFTQAVKLTMLSAKSDSRGFPTPNNAPLVGSFYQCVCYRPFYGGSGRGGFGLTG
ncbi:hypothetical protein L7750_18880 [Xenorhabdus bovienii]|uniref:hypothetical protein n=1 Tax=Xenorhabdus bovienii TaxID=40576 RepID=UPI001EDD953D|nr:hypothetical protein [Xenorhabdus bovienii]MCG3472363.1 hypothetical protein [Xenorhabdus bovienii]MDE1492638.1 hypothetical protein [Xenorhabdus bovienii]